MRPVVLGETFFSGLQCSFRMGIVPREDVLLWFYWSAIVNHTPVGDTLYGPPDFMVTANVHKRRTSPPVINRLTEAKEVGRLFSAALVSFPHLKEPIK